MKSNAGKNKIKATVFGLFFVAALLLFNLSPLGDYLNPRSIRALAGHAGLASPVIFVLIYAIGISMFLPASLFTGIGAILFGVSWGLFYNMTGAMLGASMSFWIARYLGRDFIKSQTGEQLHAYDDKLATMGFETTLYLRLIFFPFTPLNFGLGLTGVTFGRFFWGTFFGKIASGVILTFFFATLSEVWSNGEWQGLLSWESALSLGLFLSSFFIPAAARRIFPTLAAKTAPFTSHL